MEPIFRLIYSSSVSPGFPTGGAVEILAISKKNNERCGVTGFMVFDETYFLQCLEGGQSAVNRLYHKIAKDPRHEAIFLLDYRLITERLFENWSMGLALPTEGKLKLLKRFSIGNEFRPQEMSGDQALAFLRATAEEAGR